MGQDADPGEGEPRQITLIVRVDGLSQELRLGVDRVRAVHGAGAGAHYRALVIPQNLLQTDLAEKAVLGWHVAAGEKDQPASVQQRLELAAVAVVEQKQSSQLYPALRKRQRHIPQLRVVHFEIRGIRGDDQTGHLRPGGVTQQRGQAPFIVDGAGPPLAVLQPVDSQAAGK